ncbi:NAD-dependent epimerase/dehydratase family protein [Nonomuraea ferruginea]
MRTTAELEERLARPSAGLVADLAALDGDIMILGAGGKLGPSLVRLALNATGGDRRIIAVSRFSEPGLADALVGAGATVVSADVADDRALRELPEAPNVVFLVGAKFGTQGREHATWFTNTYLPGRVADRFRGSRIAALSTGNVYPLVPVVGGGSVEDDPAGPVGEYAMSCLGRERTLAHFAEAHGTPMALIRLNYAVELRYGVLVDLAQKVLVERARRPDHRPGQRGVAGVRERGDAPLPAARRDPAVRAQRDGPRADLGTVGRAGAGRAARGGAGVHRRGGADGAAVGRVAVPPAVRVSRDHAAGADRPHRRLGGRRRAAAGQAHQVRTP